jgi:hypothetical protein
MGTRRRDTQRRQVSLAVEALEDRFLLSGAASLSIPAATNGPPALPAATHLSAAPKETRSVTPQEMPGYPATGQTIALPVNPIMSSPREQDGDDDDPPGKTDEDASHNIAMGFPLPGPACNNSTCGIDSTLPPRSLEQMTLPAANLMPFLPLFSASGLGVTKIISVPPIIPATAVSVYAPEHHGPPPGKEEMRPMPAAPETPPSALPPLVEKPAGAPSSGGPFAELLPIDVEAIQRGVDAFFQRMGDLSEEWRDGQLLEKLAPWLLAASVVGYGWIRLRDRRDRDLADLLGCEQPETVPTIFLPGGER